MAHYKKNCVFCKVAQNKIDHFQFWEDKTHAAFLDRYPSAFGHTLVIPKNHVSYVFDLHKKEYLALLLRAEQIARALKKLTKCKRVVLSIYGFAIPHTHVHLIPLNGLPKTSGRMKKPNKKEMQAFADKMKKYLQK